MAGLTYKQHVANWVVNDYRAIIKRNGPARLEARVAIAATLREWHEGHLTSTEARRRLRELCEA